MALVEESPPATVQSVLRYGGLVFREVCYKPEVSMPSHAHEEAHLFLCLGGTVQHDRGSTSCLLTPAMLAFVPDEQSHANRFHNRVRTFDIVLETQWMERLRQFAPPTNKPAEYENSPPNWLAARLYREFCHRDNLTPLMLESLTLELLAQLSRYSPECVEVSHPRWLVRTVEFLRAHFTQGLSLDEIAIVVGVHPDHLTRAFRQHYHVSIGDYVRRLRIEYACHLLTSSLAPLSEIARETGFADQSHFHKNFKKLMGMTPMQFRIATDAGKRHKPLS